jgi:hypothetical protein
MDSPGHKLVSRNRLRHRRRYASGALLGFDPDVRARVS